MVVCLIDKAHTDLRRGYQSYKIQRQCNSFALPSIFLRFLFPFFTHLSMKQASIYLLRSLRSNLCKRSFFDLGDSTTASIAGLAPPDPSQELKMEEEALNKRNQVAILIDHVFILILQCLTARTLWSYKCVCRS
jgi:hypothetical protein